MENKPTTTNTDKKTFLNGPMPLKNFANPSLSSRASRLNVRGVNAYRKKENTTVRGNANKDRETIQF